MTKLHCHAAAAGAGRLQWRATEYEAIVRRLADINVRYKRVELPDVQLDGLADQDEVIEAFRLPLDALMQDDGFVGLDVTSVHDGQPGQAALRRQMMKTHAHVGIEGHLLVEGKGRLCMQAGTDIYALHGEAGDFVRLPGGLCHWFDMGPRPGFRSIRLYTDKGALETVGDCMDMHDMSSATQAQVG